MAIEIYDNAKIIKKGDKFYYFLKYGSKNCYTLGYQTVIDKDFRDKFLLKQARDSNWSIIAHGGIEEWKNNKIALTYWNCPTGSVYGLIRFGDKKNIALYFVRNKDKYLDYDLLEDIQKRNIDSLIKDQNSIGIDLSNIPEGKIYNPICSYCGTTTKINDNNSIVYKNIRFWSLNNL